jgi:tRNA-specific adenosine deaminase 1
MLSKISLLQLTHNTHNTLGHPVIPSVSIFFISLVTLYILHSESASESYYGAKQAAGAYQAAKRSLLSQGAPFEGWVVSGEEWESFDARGDSQATARRNP